MNPRSTLCLTLGTAIFAGFANAGEIGAQESVYNPGTWCENIGDWAKVYRNRENPFIQSVKFDGRMHYQWGYTDYHNNLGPDFDGEGSELRRLRVGTKIDFLNTWHFRAIANLEDGGFRDDQLDFNSMDEVYLQYHFGDFAGIKDFKLSYGRHKYDIGLEVHQSSNTIRTVERTNISNTLYKGGRPTGLMAMGTYRGLQFTLGILSTDRDDILGSWDKETAYYMSLEKDALGGRFIGDFLWNDGSGVSDDVWGYQWAASLAYQTEIGRWNVIADVLGGEGFDGDSTVGFYLIPSTFLIKDELELVLRYEFAAGHGTMLRPNSRNDQNVAPSGTFGEVDRNQSIYAGLNYYFCDSHAKLMLGIDYEEFEGPATDLGGTTLWSAFRFYF